MTSMPIPKLTDVQSSNIAAVGHENGDLFVRFKSGPTWKYADVSPAKYQEMMGSHSVGSFFAREIKANHSGTLVPEPKA